MREPGFEPLSSEALKRNSQLADLAESNGPVMELKSFPSCPVHSYPVHSYPYSEHQDLVKMRFSCSDKTLHDLGACAWADCR